MFTALALLIVVGIATLMLILDLSPALGTFLAGVVLANSEFRHEMESDLQPFKGLLLGLFFITVGAGMNFDVLLANPGTLLGLTVAVMAVKFAVLFALALVFKIRGRDRWLFTLGLAQAGEFGFVLVGFGLTRNVIPSDIGQPLYMIIALSMLLTPLFFILYEYLSRRLHADLGRDVEADDIDPQGPIIIAGIGRFGQVVNRMVQMSGFQTTVLDHDLNTIRLMRQFGFKSFLGDPTRPDLLHAAGLERARVLVAAMDDKDSTTRLVEYARKQRPDLHIVARAHDRVHVYELFQAGANDIVREMFDSSLRAARYVLENMGLSEFEAAKAEEVFYKVDRRAMLELAELWQPGVPVTENASYMQRARQLNKELETALVSELGNADRPGRPAGDAQEPATLAAIEAASAAVRDPGLGESGHPGKTGHGAS
jgi:CPA2 family monovalent cation:H+ antiporter-2